MKKSGKRLAAAALFMLTTALLSGCGGEDKVGVVDMTRVQKEAPIVQQYKQKTDEKREAANKELQEAQQSMSAEDFQKKEQQVKQELNIYAASMQRQFLSDMQSKLGDIAKEKNVGIVVVKSAVPQGGIDVTDDLIAKMK
ncbi:MULTISPECIES: OmpH family outer membrane protein [Megasphaera]|uniref:Outer membrane protein, OmpH-like domain protein n=1 Tax=Megasphaera vaginalis (ex Srinivasan et al. 2021) TaxID=1111454 RepID=U7UH49_9FIRM|nr:MULTISPECIES: OmpH family outer membrane protein [Megasphaera]ERT58204.1 outer membrane protein, OmpH-like domain protein [Megasphaera vaginalis (ex Srinivasan et al. 2021)]